MRRRTIWAVTGIAILFLVSVFIYNYVAPSVSAQDVLISGTIRQADTDTYEVDLQITRTKEDKDQHMVYPVVPGWVGLSFQEEQDEDLYLPSSVGTSYVDQVILENYLKQQEKPRTSAENLMGFSIPEEVGTYKMQFTLRSLEETDQPLENPMVYYVHNEQLLGKDLSWVTGDNLEIIKEYLE